jgi:hypothetical protein
MDALVKLALMTRASRVVFDPATEPEKFLSFPTTSPFSYSLEQLRFASKPETSADWQSYSEFSRIVNRVTRGAIYDPAAEPLENVVRDVLDSAESASAPGVLDEAVWRDALQLLYETGDDGQRQPSAAVRLYKYYREAVRVAEQFMRERQQSAELSGNPELLRAWNEDEAPALKQHLAALTDAWETKGQRSTLDAAWETERAHAAAEAGQTWMSWRAQFNADLDMPTDVLLNRFAATSFTPAGLAESGDWNSIVMARAEIDALALEAPQELRETLGVPGQVSDITRVAVDYRTVGLDRPWLPRELFTSRIWRLPDAGALLSDGAGGGRCPAFPIGVVFARNIEVVRQPAGSAEPRRMLLKAASLFDASVPAPIVAEAPGGVAFAPGGFAVTPAPSGPVVRDHRRGVPVSRFIRDHRVPDPTGVAPPAPPAPPEPSPPQEPPPEPDPLVEAADPNLTILAFICRRLPLCPNPDPALLWSSV